MSTVMLRGVCFLLVGLLGFFAPYMLFMGAVIVYLLFWEGIELLVLGVCIDAQFGTIGGTQWYMYTLGTAAVLLAAVLIKPYIRFYESDV